MPLTLDIAARADALRGTQVPASARAAARLALADGLATMAGAVAREPACKPFDDHARAQGPGRATLIAGGTAPAEMAALGNGALSHALDYEDTFDAAGLHPNAALIPAVLALAEDLGAGGDDVVAALAVGCDFACRVGLALRADPGRRGWYHPPMIGALGAAFGAAHLMRLSPEKTASALALTTVQFSLTDALKRAPASDLRAVRDGLSARAAVEAVSLAARGVRALDAPLEDDAGVFAMLSGSGPSDALTDGYGDRFLGPEVTIKTWPCCRGTHRYIAAGLALRAEGIEGIERIGVAVRPPDDMLLQPLRDRQAPGTAIGARFSIPFTLAWALLRGEPTLNAFSLDALNDPEIGALAKRIEPDATGADVEPSLLVESRTGRRHVVCPEPPARIAGHLDLEDLRRKSLDCVGIAATGKLFSWVSALEGKAAVSLEGLFPVAI